MPCARALKMPARPSFGGLQMSPVISGLCFEYISSTLTCWAAATTDEAKAKTSFKLKQIATSQPSFALLTLLSLSLYPSFVSISMSLALSEGRLAACLAQIAATEKYVCKRTDKSGFIPSPRNTKMSTSERCPAERSLVAFPQHN